MIGRVDAGERYYREVTAAFSRIKTATLDLTSSGTSDRLSVHSAPSSATQWLERHSSLSLDLYRGLHFDRSFMSISTAAAGLGVCLDSILLAHAEIASGRLVKPLGGDGPEVQGHRLACQIANKDLPRIVTFKTWLAAILSDV